ncbi:Crp/Fnr family transcriptional regulator [Ekhidna sp.]|uniref:Crp/Fnr family transcriptional regulator n=1 Tax=Ekhidna sp. TaxID=2608089 RepID=UPI003B50408B
MNSAIKNLFDQNFGKYTSLTRTEYDFLEQNFHEFEYSQREMIVEGGNYSKYFYFVLSGVQALYLINDKGEKVVLGFSFQGSPSGAFDSFVSGEPSHFFLEALTDSVMIGINKTKFDELFQQFPAFYKWRAHFMENILLGRISREVEMMTLSAKDRFNAFIKRCHPELLQIPQKFLASYLNMKPETFSRLRAIKD